MHRGYIKLWRKIQDSFFYKDSEAVHLWIHILLECNHKDTVFMFNGEKQICKRGQKITGLNALSLETGINKSKIYRLLEVLKSETLIEIQKTNKFSLISVINYEKYQCTETQNETQMKLKRNSNETQVKTNNNDNNDNNDKNDKNNNIDIRPETIDYEFFKKTWNDHMQSKIITLSEKRKQKLKTRIEKDNDFSQHFNICLIKINESDFLSGRKGGWSATFDWLIDNDTNYLKVLEGNYKDNAPKNKAEESLENARKYIKSLGVEAVI